MKFLLSFLLLPLSLYAQDSLLKAIKLSNPELVKKEIAYRIHQGKYFSYQEQLFYLNFSEEVITRRRNAIQFPNYYKGQAIYTPAFPTDKDPEISGNCALRGVVGLIGMLVAFPYCFPDYRTSNRTITIAVASEIISLILLTSSCVEYDMTRKAAQEQLYENSIQIKYLFYNIETVN